MSVFKYQLKILAPDASQYTCDNKKFGLLGDTLPIFK
jgi:hypothetical protein